MNVWCMTCKARHSKFGSACQAMHSMQGDPWWLVPLPHQLHIPSEVMIDAANVSGPNTLVASVVPPMPVSTTAMSTFSSAKCLNAGTQAADQVSIHSSSGAVAVSYSMPPPDANSTSARTECASHAAIHACMSLNASYLIYRSLGLTTV